MSLSFAKHLSQKISLGLFAVAFAFVFLSGSSPTLNAKTTEPALHVRIIEDKTRRVLSTEAEPYKGQIYVRGMVRRDSGGSPASHVHVEWLNKAGTVVAMKTGAVLFSGTPALSPRGPYSVSFAPSEVRGAEAVRVVYHGYPHAYCKKSDTRS
ncbi:hypothetical protein [Verrucomicrobium sp. GAS474]|uniref:hypothetical protein n=1 Tax=Verrucomicrobium sp. GAS474 TaxID=1882831 RepID=UPI000B864272|nr:hypothetical protein [Verrucomicrobium sp. GAS474]